MRHDDDDDDDDDDDEAERRYYRAYAKIEQCETICGHKMGRLRRSSNSAIVVRKVIKQNGRKKRSALFAKETTITTTIPSLNLTSQS